jgi:carbamoyl-phosphate synthase large subunit
VHSGDSACCFPTYSITEDEKDEMVKITTKIARSLDVLGAINVQMALKDGVFYVIEVNPRISRTLPFISKATKCPLVEITTKVMLGMGLRECLANYGTDDFGDHLTFKKLEYFYIKEAVFSFEKFRNCDVLLAPEMRSTGEAMGIGKTFNEAFIKTLMGAKISVKKGEIILISAVNVDKRLECLVTSLKNNGCKIMITQSTPSFLDLESVDNAVKLVKDRQVGILISVNRTPDDDDFYLRREVLLGRIPYATNIETAEILANALIEYHVLNNIKIVG